MSFYNELNKYNWKEVFEQIYSKTNSDVEAALSKNELSLSDFQSLISPAASRYLEEIAAKSMQITQKRFGKTIQLYIPLYLSNTCSNTCVYCGFSAKNNIRRKTLSLKEAVEEAELIKNLGFEHILLVTGEDNYKCGVSYLSEMVNEIRNMFSQVSIEVQPLESEEYKQLIQSGLNSVYIYQETYNEKKYKTYHPTGKKSNFQYRLETPDRLGSAGVHKIGLGCLLGLEDWRVDSFFTALHLSYLERKYWQTKYSISFPRLRPHTGRFEPNHAVNQKELFQLICAYRLFNEQVELSLSTRESPAFRDNMLRFGVTTYSAGSKTNPGGYTDEHQSLEQFSVHDDRSPSQIAEMVKSKGFEVVWKDWDHFMQR